jgi:hypothetical protein
MDTSALLKKWLDRAQRNQNAHYEAAASLDRTQYWVGYPLVTLSTIVGTSVFATLGETAYWWAKFGVALASVLVAVLGAIQTFLKPAERSERHKMAGMRYGGFKREIEETLAFPPSNPEDLQKFVTDIRLRWDKLVEESPTIPKSIWDHYGAHEPKPTQA